MPEFITIPTSLISELPDDKKLALLDILSMADDNGEVQMSERELMKRWKWGNTKVRNFIDYLIGQSICKAPDKAETKHPTKQRQSTKILVNTDFLHGTQSRDKAPDKAETKHPTKQRQSTESKENAEIYKRIIDYLNMVCGTNYGAGNKQTKEHINARLRDGFTEQDFYTVIDKKAGEWKGTKMEPYLRPITLFNTKFESYLNQTIVKEQNKGNVDILNKWRNS